MISPAPTSPPTYVPTPQPDQRPEPHSDQRVTSVPPDPPRRQRFGDTSTAHTIRAILRPILKGLYYLIQAIRTHKRLTLLALTLLIASIFATNYFITGTAVSNPYQEIQRTAGDRAEAWMHALRTGNVTQLTLFGQEFSVEQKPDPQELVNNFSETQAKLKWEQVSIIGSSTTEDGLKNTIVQIDFVSQGQGADIKGTMIWYMNTDPSNGRLHNVQLIDVRRTT